MSLLDECFNGPKQDSRSTSLFQSDPAFRYFEDSGMIARGWITERRLQDCILLKRRISQLSTTSKYRDLLRLALVDTIVRAASNVRFGPELYCSTIRTTSVLDEFAGRVRTMAEDLSIVPAWRGSNDLESCLEIRATFQRRYER